MIVATIWRILKSSKSACAEYDRMHRDGCANMSNMFRKANNLDVFCFYCTNNCNNTDRRKEEGKVKFTYSDRDKSFNVHCYCLPARSARPQNKALSEEILYYWPVVVPRMHIAVNKHACYIVQLLLLRQRANRLLLLSLFMWQSSFLHLPLSCR